MCLLSVYLFVIRIIIGCLMVSVQKIIFVVVVLLAVAISVIAFIFYSKIQETERE